MAKSPLSHQVSVHTQARLDQAADDLKAAHMTDFGVVQNELEIAEPREIAVPHIWRWRAVSPLLDKVYSGMSLNEVHRRTLALTNPGMNGRPLATTTMLTSMSIYYPGDIAGVHRHTASASRFLLEGHGAYTTVGGEKCPLERGDLVITPNGEWHDHGNDGTSPIIWVNVLDIGLVESLNAIFTEWEYYEVKDGNRRAAKAQSHVRPAGWSDMILGQGEIVPRFGPEERGRGIHSPKYLYPWSKTREVLHALRNEAGSPYDGIIVEYTNPVDGGSVVPTMSFQAQLLRPQEITRTHRHTANSVYCVLEGEGWTDIGGERFEWQQNDIFVVPGWKWHRHSNSSATSDACLYSVSDAPVHHKLHFYREQEMADGNSVREVFPWPYKTERGSHVSAEVVVG